MGLELGTVLVKCGSRTERAFLKISKTTVRIARVLVYIFKFRHLVFFMHLAAYQLYKDYL